ncbi:sperm microtubule associated protein 2-like isoform X2 [Pelodiscus sinensis]|uniref:sperm microtubule associated protein 2-like isoform X2 n=1 Tax=Pelodiscus sinensis TaxID=13735 RepID=UPI003F6CDBBA
MFGLPTGFAKSHFATLLEILPCWLARGGGGLSPHRSSDRGWHRGMKIVQASLSPPPRGGPPECRLFPVAPCCSTNCVSQAGDPGVASPMCPLVSLQILHSRPSGHLIVALAGPWLPRLPDSCCAGGFCRKWATAASALVWQHLRDMRRGWWGKWLSWIRELARPKKPKAAWENYSSPLEWGNQETIWPLSPSALTARPTPRIMSLAKPKQNVDGNLQRRRLYLYSCGRVSEIWQCPPRVNVALPSPRTLKLAEPKKYQAAYFQRRPRSSPEWLVSTAALTCEASQRVLELAHPKLKHKLQAPPGRFSPFREHSVWPSPRVGRIPCATTGEDPSA